MRRRVLVQAASPEAGERPERADRARDEQHSEGASATERAAQAVGEV